jgi:hypothetical protein
MIAGKQWKRYCRNVRSRLLSTSETLTPIAMETLEIFERSFYGKLEMLNDRCLRKFSYNHTQLLLSTYFQISNTFSPQSLQQLKQLPFSLF